MHALAKAINTLQWSEPHGNLQTVHLKLATAKLLWVEEPTLLLQVKKFTIKKLDCQC